jgi:2-polyprenyl-6-methoxyphenol hydroxylase-like FAD-dependent oxidoreductase
VTDEPAVLPIMRGKTVQEGEMSAQGRSTALPLTGKRAVVVGAGVGGLASAGALAPYFEKVVVLERDRLPETPGHRTGTPQSRHIHLLQVGGQRALSEIFPDFEPTLARVGAVPIKVGLDVRVERPGYDPFPQRDVGYVAYAASRPAIEYAARQCVESLENATLRQGCRVRELTASPDGMRVTGLVYENADGTRDTLAADFVVDASGRGALTQSLLRSVGETLPARQRSVSTSAIRAASWTAQM